jgi:hypothetical protein
MNTENPWAIASITPASIEAIVRRARVERAEVTRAAIAGIPAMLMRLVAYFRPIRERVPHTRAWA